jgi:hypothetical protein
MLRSAGQFRKRGGEWETFYVPREDWPGMSDPERFDLMAPPEKPPQIIYPTLAEISAQLRSGTDCTHEQLVDVMEPVRISMVPGVILCA